MNMKEEMDDDDDWVPPTEAEMKVILARRERADKISKLMGEYLLKGYKMLSESCECGTILLRDKHNQDYCVACHELDTDLAKDDPALSARAASSQLQEAEFHSAAPSNSEQGTQRAVAQPPSIPMNVEMNGASACPSSHHAPPQPAASNLQRSQTRSNQQRVVSSTRSSAGDQEILLDSEAVLQEKLRWATDQLRAAESVEGSIPLCELIRASADALCSIRCLMKDSS